MPATRKITVREPAITAGCTLDRPNIGLRSGLRENPWWRGPASSPLRDERTQAADGRQGLTLWAGDAHHCRRIARTTLTGMRLRISGSGSRYTRTSAARSVVASAIKTSRTWGGSERARTLQGRPSRALQDRMALLLGPSREVQGLQGLGDHGALIAGGWALGNERAAPTRRGHCRPNGWLSTPTRRGWRPDPIHGKRAMALMDTLAVPQGQGSGIFSRCFERRWVHVFCLVQHRPKN